jgi:DNA polymerase-3 subunit beta
MHELMGLLQGDAESVELAEDDSTLFFRVGSSRLLTARKLNGQFPNFEAVLPRENTKIVTLGCDEMANAIQRVAQFADERSGAIRLKLESNELRLLANSNEMGEAEDILEIKYQADPMTIGFNSQYLLDFLKVASTGEVRLELKDAQSAGQLRPAENGDEFKYRYVIMPMRI